MTVGCGGEATNGDPKTDASGGGAATSNGDGTVSSGDSSTSSSAGQTGQSNVGASDQVPATPGAGTGIQLPDAALPDGAESGAESSSESTGPTKPGAGGIEMPDLNSSSQSGTYPQPAEVANSNPAVNLQFASWAAIESHAKSTGKITVVDLWSTVCSPCVKEFPGLVRLSNAMPDDVTCIGVSVDYDGRKSRPPQSYTEKVSGFLSSVGAKFENFLCDTPSDDVFAAVDLPSIPAVLIYDANGNLVKRFIDSGETIGFSYDKDVIPFVEKLAG
ncbi:MAG: TlpA family protein disulfide reductase [Planctomycetales bacterium]|nr:TlpA family protein disulfide reductase [Planctomycetales bacterium]